MNNVIVQIQNEKGNWCTWNNVAIPIKYGQLLDEQLDYAQISLVRIRKARLIYIPNPFAHCLIFYLAQQAMFALAQLNSFYLSAWARLKV